MDPDRLRATSEKVVKQFHANIHLLILDEANSETEFLDRLRDLLEAMTEQKPEIGGYLLQPANFNYYGHLLYRKFAGLERSPAEFDKALADTAWRSKPAVSSGPVPAVAAKEKEQVAKALADARAASKPTRAQPGKLHNLAKQFELGQIKNASNAVRVDTSADEALARGLNDAWRRRNSDAEELASELLIAKLNSDNLNYLEAKRLEEESASLNEALAAKLIADEKTAIERARQGDEQAVALAKRLQEEEEARARALVSNQRNAEQQGLAAALRLMAQAEAEEKAARRRADEEQDAFALRLQREEEQRVRQEALRRREIDERDAALAAELMKKEQSALVLTRSQSVEQDALLAAEILHNEEQARILSRAQAAQRNAQLAAQFVRAEADEEQANLARRLAYKQQGDQDTYRSYLRAAISLNSIDRDGLVALADLRRRLGISEEGHFLILAELGVSRDQFTQMIKNGQSSVASSFSLPPYDPGMPRAQSSRESWTVLTPLRVRAAPVASAEEVCQLSVGKTVAGHQQGHWLHHDLGWSMIHSDPAKGDIKYFLQREVKNFPPVNERRQELYEVLIPLRVREAPSPTSTEVLILEVGSKVNCLEMNDIWLRHDLGWSMIHSDPSKGAIKYYLQRQGDDGRVG